MFCCLELINISNLVGRWWRPNQNLYDWICNKKICLGRRMIVMITENFYISVPKQRQQMTFFSIFFFRKIVVCKHNFLISGYFVFHRQTRRLAITEAKVKLGFNFPESFVPIVSATRAMSYVADGI